MGREFELKYKADADVQRQIREACPGDWRTISMETTYYDTVDAILGKQCITLRRRMENGVSVCTVKTPAIHGARGEWETECGDIELAIPELCKLGAPAELETMTRGGVKPTCGAKFTRQALTLALADCTVELALDAGILLGGGREEPLCEVEVELKTGGDEAAVAFAREFSRRFGLEEENRSKFRRALALAAGE